MWAAFHAYAITVLARLETSLEDARRQYRIDAATFRQRRKRDYKTKWELDDALLLNSRLRKQADVIAELEKRVRTVEPVVESYAGFRHAASREITRRGHEQAQD